MFSLAVCSLTLGCSAVLGYEQGYELGGTTGDGGSAGVAQGGSAGRAGASNEGGRAGASGSGGGSRAGAGGAAGGTNIGGAGQAGAGGGGGITAGGAGGTTSGGGAGAAGTSAGANAGAAGANAGAAGTNAGAAGSGGAKAGAGGSAGGSACDIPTAPPPTCTEDLSSTMTHCGACDLSCGTKSPCVDGTCTLTAGPSLAPFSRGGDNAEGIRPLAFDFANDHLIVATRVNNVPRLLELGLSLDLPAPRALPGALDALPPATPKPENVPTRWGGGALGPDDTFLAVGRFPSMGNPIRKLVQLQRGNTAASPVPPIGRLLVGDGFEATARGFTSVGVDTSLRDGPVVVGNAVFVWEKVGATTGTLTRFQLPLDASTPATPFLTPRNRLGRPVVFGDRLYYASQGSGGEPWTVRSAVASEAVPPGNFASETLLPSPGFSYVTQLAVGGRSLFLTETSVDPNVGTPAPKGRLHRFDLAVNGCAAGSVDLGAVDLPLSVSADDRHVFIVAIDASDDTRKTFVLTRRFHDGTGLTVLQRETRAEAFRSSNEQRLRFGWGTLPAHATGSGDLLLLGIGDDVESKGDLRTHVFGLPR